MTIDGFVLSAGALRAVLDRVRPSYFILEGEKCVGVYAIRRKRFEPVRIASFENRVDAQLFVREKLKEHRAAAVEMARRRHNKWAMRHEG